MTDALPLLGDWLLVTARDLALLSLLLLAVDRLAGPRLGPRARYLLWSLLLVRMLLPALPPDPLGWKASAVPTATAADALPAQGVTADLRSWRLPERRPAAAQPTAVTALDLDAQTLGEAVADSNAELEAVGNRPAALHPASPREHFAAAPSASALGAAPQAPSRAVAAPLTARSLQAALAWAWALGAGLLLLRLLLQELRFRRALRDDACPAPASLQRALDEAAARVGLRRRVAALITGQVPAPAVYGVFRPRLLMPPTALARLSDRELQHVLGHEVAHLRAGDTLLCWLLAVARALHWYHPLARLGLRRMQAAQEVLRDYQALGREPGADPGGYAATVLKLGAPPPARPMPAPIPAILEDGKDLKRRIQMIVDFPLRRRGATLLGTCLLAGVGWVGLTGATVPASAPDLLAPPQDPQIKSVRVVRQDPIPAWMEQMNQQLTTPMTMAVQGASLEEMLDAIRAQTGVNIVVDRDIEISADGYDLQANGRTAAQVLDLLCDANNLEWGLTPGVVLIGWQGDNPFRYDLRFYAVGELIDGDPDPEYRAELLMEQLTNLSWRGWDSEYASMRYWNGLLIVQQTERGHAKVESLLNLFLNRGGRAPASAPQEQLALDAQLDTPIDVDFDEQGFAAVVRSLSERTGVPMYVHPDNADSGMITLQLKGLPLRSVLEWIGRQTWTHVVVEDGMVRFVEQPSTEVRLYDVADLLRNHRDDPEYATEQLVELVQEGAGWSSWAHEDASISSWDDMLVVVQTPDAHERIARFLGALREAL